MSVSVVDIFQIVQVKHHYANTECAWAVAQLLNKLFQRCFVVNAGDIPECIYDKTGEKLSLDKGKCQGCNKKCQSCLHKPQHRMV